MELIRSVHTEGAATTITAVIEADECDIHGSWRTSAAIAAMQEATHYEREALGIGWSTLSAKDALWVVSRLELSFERVPQLGETINICATAMPAEKILFPWHFVFTDADDTVIGEGRALWNLMSRQTRRITIVPGVTDKIPGTAGSGRAFIPAAAVELDGDARHCTLCPAFSELDINGHVSNIRYADWCCNALAEKLLSGYCVSALHISYLREVRPGEDTQTRLCVDGDEFSFSGSSDEGQLFIMRGRLSPA